MRYPVLHLLCAGAVLAACPTALSAQDDSGVAEAMNLLEAGRANEAYAMLSAEADSRAGDPDFDLALGIAASESGRPAEAIVALQRVLAVRPGDSRAKAELALAYAQAGDIDTARSEFRTVLDDPTVPDPVRRRIDGYVERLDRQAGEGGPQLTGFLDVTGGYDSNINTATDASSITLPLFAFLGPATLNGAAREQGDEFYQVQGGLSLSMPLSRQTRVYASGLGNYRDNLDYDFVDQISATGTVGVAHSLLNGDAISLSGQVQGFWLDDRDYRTTYGVVGQYTKRLTGGRALAVAAQYYRLDYDGQPLQDADRYALSVTYSDRHLYGGIGGGVEDTVRSGADHLGNSFVNAQIGGEYPLGPRLTATAGVSVEYRGYDDQDPLYLSSREDVQLDVAAGLRFAFADALSVRPRVTYTSNDSDLALYDYERVTASLGLRYDF